MGKIKDAMIRAAERMEREHGLPFDAGLKALTYGQLPDIPELASFGFAQGYGIPPMEEGLARILAAHATPHPFAPHGPADCTLDDDPCKQCFEPASHPIHPNTDTAPNGR